MGQTLTKTKYICQVVRIDSVIIFHPSKQITFFVLCDVVFLVKLQGNFVHNQLLPRCRQSRMPPKRWQDVLTVTRTHCLFLHGLLRLVTVKLFGRKSGNGHFHIVHVRWVWPGY